MKAMVKLLFFINESVNIIKIYNNKGVIKSQQKMDKIINKAAPNRNNEGSACTNFKDFGYFL